MVDRQNRIFFLGMHVVLTNTELPRLRSLGYEVFNPPYLSKIYDQSANMNWDASQPSTLPREAFEILSRTNFFYEPITPEAAEVLNEYFGTVFITINPDWLAELTKVYKGRILYRTYGQPWSITEALKDRGLLKDLQERPEFHILPFAEECCWDEHDFLRERMKFIPYCLTEEIFPLRDTWNPDYASGKVMVPIPNIKNPYYRNQYEHIRVHFPGDHIRIYGVQPEPSSDPRVVGTLPRMTQLRQYQQLAGQFYPYHDENVCYLPPIEFMTIGGPVIYAPNSLLHKYFGPSSPGLAMNLDEQRRKINWLRRGDGAFISDVLSSQLPVRKRYAPEYVWPIFDQTIHQCIEGKLPAPPPTLILDIKSEEKPEVTPAPPPAKNRRRAYLLFHFPGGIVGFRRGEYYSTEGIPRTMVKFVRTLVERTDLEVVITCAAPFALNVHGFFGAPSADGRVKVLIVDPENFGPGEGSLLTRLLRPFNTFARNTRRSLNKFKDNSVKRGQRIRASVARLPVPILRPILDALLRLIGSVARLAWRSFRGIYRLLARFKSGPLASLRKSTVTTLRKIVDKSAPLTRKLPLPWFLRRHQIKLWLQDRRASAAGDRLVSAINADPDAAFTLVPHYYLFPESLRLKNKLVLFLFDYMPHFFPGVVFEPGKDEKNAEIGRQLCAASHTILTGSGFSASYLPDTVLKTPREKLAVVPIPMLTSQRKEILDDERELLESKVDGKRYVFYPTANRPNKQIALLLEVIGEVLLHHPDLHLVLTCNLAHHPPALESFNRVNKQLERARARAAREAEIMGEAGGDTAIATAPVPLLTDRIIFVPGVSDAGLQWLYSQAAAICFTSTMEGNFPPQIFEALTFGCPIVATRLPLITEVLGENSDDLLFCDPMDKACFVSQLLKALEDPEAVRAKQAKALEKILAHSGDESFYARLAKTLNDRGLI